MGKERVPGSNLPHPFISFVGHETGNRCSGVRSGSGLKELLMHRKLDRFYTWESDNYGPVSENYAVPGNGDAHIPSSTDHKNTGKRAMETADTAAPIFMSGSDCQAPGVGGDFLGVAQIAFD